MRSFPEFGQGSFPREGVLPSGEAGQNELDEAGPKGLTGGGVHRGSSWFCCGRLTLRWGLALNKCRTHSLLSYDTGLLVTSG